MTLNIAKCKWRGMIGRRLITLILPGLLFFPAWTKAASPPIEKTLEVYLKVFPGTKNIGVVYSEASLEKNVRELEAAARARNIKLVKIVSPSIKEFPGAVKEIKDQVDTIWVLDDPLYSIQDVWSFFLFFTIREKIKTVVSSEKGMKDCGLFYYSDQKEIIVNKKMLDILGLKVSKDAGEVKYYVPGA